MNLWFTQLCLLAEDAAPPQQPNILVWMIPALLIFFLFQMLFASSPQKREQKHIDYLKASLKKNDAVVTAGGILGTVANVSPERNEVTIKVDDNTKIRVQMRSVLALPKEESKDQKTEPPPPVETK
jgi:preprotein translocase subunit YajC